MSHSDKQQHPKLVTFCFRLFELLAVLSFVTVVWDLKAPKWAHELVMSLDGSMSLAFLAGTAVGVSGTLAAIAWAIWKFINKDK